MFLIHCGFFAIIGLNCYIIAKRCDSGKIKEDNTIICTCPKRFQYIGLDHTMECRKCSVCPAGYGVKSKCTIYNDTVCEKCKAGYYSRRGSKYCKKCRECPENYDVIHVCTFDHNTRCKPCKQGRYYSKEKNKCLKCHACPPGSYTKRQCSATSNTLCKHCPRGTYTDKYGMNTACKPCRTCKYNEDILRPCTRSNDNICGDCTKGFFRLIASGDCGRCSECYGDFPGYTFEIPECIRRSNGSDKVCMPVSSPPYNFNDTEDVQIKVLDTEYSRQNTGLSPLYIIVIGGVGAILLFATTTIIIICRIHRIKMKKIDRSYNSSSSKRNSKIYTENWVNHEYKNTLVSMRSNSVPFAISGSDSKYNLESRGRSNTFSNKTDLEYFFDDSSGMVTKMQDRWDDDSCSTHLDFPKEVKESPSGGPLHNIFIL